MPIKASVIRPNLYVTALLLGFSFEMAALAQSQPSDISPQQQEIDKLLKEARWKRQEILKGRFEPVLRDLGRSSGGEFRDLYFNAVYLLKFSEDARSEKAFQEWQKDHRELVADPRLEVCTKIASLNLQGHIYLILGDRDKASSRFLDALNEIAGAPDNVAGFHLMQEKLEDSLLLKYYKINPEYFRGNSKFLGTASDVEALFLEEVLPWYQQNHPDRIGGAWDAMINAAGKIAALNEISLQKFNLSDCPRMLMAEADCLFEANDRGHAVQALKILVQRFPESPNFDEAAQKLKEFSKPR